MPSLFDNVSFYMTEETFIEEQTTYEEIQHLLFDTFEEYLYHCIEIIIEENELDIIKC